MTLQQIRSTGLMPFALDLADFVVKSVYEDIPALAIERAKMVVASTLASAAFGTGIESARIVQDLAKECDGAATSGIGFDGGKLTLVDATRVSAMLSDAVASDDSDILNVAHIGRW